MRGAAAGDEGNRGERVAWVGGGGAFELVALRAEGVEAAGAKWDRGAAVGRALLGADGAGGTFVGGGVGVEEQVGGGVGVVVGGEGKWR